MAVSEGPFRRYRLSPLQVENNDLKECCHEVQPDHGRFYRKCLKAIFLKLKTSASRSGRIEGFNSLHDHRVTGLIHSSLSAVDLWVYAVIEVSPCIKHFQQEAQLRSRRTRPMLPTGRGGSKFMDYTFPRNGSRSLRKNLKSNFFKFKHTYEETSDDLRQFPDHDSSWHLKVLIIENHLL